MTTIDMGVPPRAGRQARKKYKESGFGIGSRMAFGIIVGVILVGGVVGWAGMAKLSGAVIGQGTVKVDQHVKQVQHRDGGTITEIAVRVGDHVEAGQVLLRLDDVQIRAELSIVSGQLMELTARQSRLQAERDGLTTISFPDVFHLDERGAALVAGETKLFAGNMLNRVRQKDQMTLQIGQLRQEVAALASQKDALDEEVAMVAEEQSKIQQLVDKGLTEGSKAYSINRERTRMIGELGAVNANIARAEGKISEIALQILAVEDAARTEAQRELRALEANLAELDERRLAIEDRLTHTEIRSPITGVVNELNVTTVGGVITPAESLITVVPDDADLKVEFRMRTTDVDQISVGQPAKLRLSAFNQRTTPEINGTVVHVSAASQRDATTGETFYLGDVELTGDLSSLGNLQLVPGMPVEVFVQTAEMTAISYLAKPFTDQMARAFKEE